MSEKNRETRTNTPVWTGPNHRQHRHKMAASVGAKPSFSLLIDSVRFAPPDSACFDDAPNFSTLIFNKTQNIHKSTYDARALSAMHISRLRGEMMLC